MLVQRKLVKLFRHIRQNILVWFCFDVSWNDTLLVQRKVATFWGFVLFFVLLFVLVIPNYNIKYIKVNIHKIYMNKVKYV